MGFNFPNPANADWTDRLQNWLKHQKMVEP